MLDVGNVSESSGLSRERRSEISPSSRLRQLSSSPSILKLGSLDDPTSLLRLFSAKISPSGGITEVLIFLPDGLLVQ